MLPAAASRPFSAGPRLTLALFVDSGPLCCGFDPRRSCSSRLSRRAAPARSRLPQQQQQPPPPLPAGGAGPGRAEPAAGAGRATLGVRRRPGHHACRLLREAPGAPAAAVAALPLPLGREPRR